MPQAILIIITFYCQAHDFLSDEEMPSFEYMENVAARSANDRPLLMLRDFRTEIQPNITQRNTVIVACAYFVSILILS